LVVVRAPLSTGQGFTYFESSRGRTNPTEQKGVIMAAPFIFIKTYAIKEGKLEDFRQFLQEFFKVLEASEPRALAINAYVNEDGTEVTFVQVHPDAASKEHHSRVAHEHVERARQFLDTTTSIQVYGKPSNVVLEKARQHADSGVPVSVKPEHLGGFTRLPATAGRTPATSQTDWHEPLRLLPVLGIAAAVVAVLAHVGIAAAVAYVGIAALVVGFLALGTVKLLLIFGVRRWLRQRCSHDAGQEGFDTHQLTAIAEVLARSTDFAYRHAALLRAQILSAASRTRVTAQTTTPTSEENESK
jgi:hypothetical protein